MLGKLVIELEGEEDKRHGYYMGSMMQSVLMETMARSYAEKMHQNKRHPYSQSILWRDGRILWTIYAADSESCRELFPPLLDPDFQTIHLIHRDETLRIIQKKESALSEEELVTQYFFGECSRYLELRFLTPTGFKQNGQYSIFPSVRLMMQSLMMKHDAVSEESTVFSEEILQDLEKYCSIVRYDLRSTIYPVGTSKIPSFIGNVVIRVNGPQQMANFVRFLAEFGIYTGIGIKTGMGMGAYEIMDHQRKQEAGKGNL